MQADILTKTFTEIRQDHRKRQSQRPTYYGLCAAALGAAPGLIRSHMRVWIINLRSLPAL